jgi:Mg2+/Co2+ transporter CorB
MKQLIKNILKEESEDTDQRVYNFLRRRYEVNEINIDDNIKFKEIYFKLDDEYYRRISVWDSKKRQIRLILNMLQENNVIEPINNFSNENDPYRQKIVRTIKKFLHEVM